MVFFLVTAPNPELLLQQAETLRDEKLAIYPRAVLGQPFAAVDCICDLRGIRSVFFQTVFVSKFKLRGQSDFIFFLCGKVGQIATHPSISRNFQDKAHRYWL